MPKVRLFDSYEKGLQIIPEGDLRLVLVNDRRICLLNMKGTFIAIEDLCPHLGHSLHLGNLNDYNEIICPLHGYRYNLKSGEESGQRSDALIIYEIEAGQDGVFLII